MPDLAAYPTLLRKAKQVAPTISHVGVDKGHDVQAVTTAAAKADVTVEVVSWPKPDHGFIVQPRRWVVERTNDCINHCRCIDRHYEITLAAQKDSSTSVKSPYYSADSTAPSCSTRFRTPPGISR